VQSEPRRLTIPAEHAGRRLDQCLADLLPSYSRSRLVAWIDAGRVTVEGGTVNRKLKVWGGEIVEIEPEESPADSVHRAEAIDLDIVHEDEALLVINKPAGLVTHPGAGNWQGTLLNALLHHVPANAALPRAGIVHRLDKDTSGLMVVAKTLSAQTALTRNLQDRSVKRLYWAVAAGRLEHNEGTIDASIGRHPTQRTRMAVLERGRPAQTHWRVLKRYVQATWLECRLATGRTHQIRVHLAHLGHPLLGDPTYGGRNRAGPRFNRQALHAERLGLIHPLTAEAMEWEAAPPEDFMDLLRRLESDDAS